MGQKADKCWGLSESLNLCEFKTGGSKGFWLYDETRGMNLSMRAATERDAFVECISYYQERLAVVELEHRELSSKVDLFVGQFIEEADDDRY